MPQLPVSGLGGAPVNDHIVHHEALHAFYNLSEIPGTATGSVLMRTDVGDWNVHQPFQTFAAHTLVHSHSVAGVATIPVGFTIKAIRINASANITGLSIPGFNTANYGPWGSIWVRVVASTAITLAFTGSNVVGSPVAALGTGQSTVFEVQWWDF